MRKYKILSELSKIVLRRRLSFRQNRSRLVVTGIGPQNSARSQSSKSISCSSSSITSNNSTSSHNSISDDSKSNYSLESYKVEEKTI
jgi:hypothetical protein